MGRTYFAGENEFLFSVGALFRVESCTESREEDDDDGSYWLVVLRLIDERAEPKLRDLFDYIMTTLIGNGNTSIETLGYILFHMGDSDSAKRYTMLLRNEPDLEPQQRATVYNNLGLLASKHDRANEALDLYHQALAIYRSITPITSDLSALTATTLGNIASIDYQLGVYDRAIRTYHEVLSMQRTAFGQCDNELTITTLSNLGSAYHSQNQFTKALRYFEQALTVCSRILPENHPTKATILDNIGNVYDDLGDEGQALENYMKCHEIRMRSLPAGHPSLSSSHVNIGITCVSCGNYSLAREHLESAWTIDQKHKSRLDPVDMAKTLSGFAALYTAQGNYAQALHYSELAEVPDVHRDNFILHT